MELDDKFALTKELIRKREEIDEQLTPCSAARRRSENEPSVLCKRDSSYGTKRRLIVQEQC